MTNRLIVLLITIMLLMACAPTSTSKRSYGNSDKKSCLVIFRESAVEFHVAEGLVEYDNYRISFDRYKAGATTTNATYLIFSVFPISSDIESNYIEYCRSNIVVYPSIKELNGE